MDAEGGCLCGAVRYEVTGEPLLKGLCCCRQCQYISGGAYNLYMAMPKQGYAYTKGEPKRFSRGKDVALPATREFCGECGTHLATLPDRWPHVVIVKVGTLDEPALFSGPDVAIFLADKQSFHAIPPDIPHYDGLAG